MTPLYPRIVGRDWRQLPELVQRCHGGLDEVRAFGRFDIRWGKNALARALARWGGLPRAGVDLPAELTVTPDPEGETWRRRFGEDSFVTRQWEEDGLLVERAGLFELCFRLEVAGARLIFQQTGAGLRLGRARIGLPFWLSPRVSARVWQEEAMRVQVEVSLPGLGTLCRYDGGLDTRTRP
jgi:hypothetical protein